MPPRSSLTSSFSVSDPQNEVVCPLKNHDGSACRKRCLGEKRYRSMQEHIRRAHPDHYIPKLPATEESFALMVNTPPSERPPHSTPSHSINNNNNNSVSGHISSHAPSVGPPGGHGLDGASFYRDPYNAYDPTPRSSDEYRRGSLLPATSAAEVLAQLHDSRQPEIHWDAEQDMFSDDAAFKPRPRFGPIEPELAFGSNDYYPDLGTPRTKELLPSSLARSPPYHHRSSIPPRDRLGKPNRPRKLSVSQNARKPKHERTKSKEHVRRNSYDRNKALSAETSSMANKLGSRWEDLIEAAASATEEDSRDLTPMPPSPKQINSNRNSLPPLMHHPLFQGNMMHTYTASPLQQALTPPPPDMGELQPFPSVESSADSSIASKQSGLNFHMSSQGLSTSNDASPTFPVAHPGHLVQIYCAGCRRLSALRDSFACTECICGLCKDCVDALSTEQQRGRLARCPRCATVGGKFKPFQLDIR
ncbi:hypothetical protein, variant 1 [Verruconis gallopava]|uniref:RING zinc finger-like domain-containing protein n=1 Tax=Verruconis gallopava TaxID=253628 RepID=A0A0D2AUC6_9PEZI|nr:hypothetical protein, variant 1 [Verruconis gallopava]KIW02754.1 hypothetical protein, variant 1 [Verruconis gallopava]